MTRRKKIPLTRKVKSLRPVLQNHHLGPILATNNVQKSRLGTPRQPLHHRVPMIGSRMTPYPAVLPGILTRNPRRTRKHEASSGIKQLGTRLSIDDTSYPLYPHQLTLVRLPLCQVTLPPRQLATAKEVILTLPQIIHQTQLSNMVARTTYDMPQYQLVQSDL